MIPNHRSFIFIGTFSASRMNETLGFLDRNGGVGYTLPNFSRTPESWKMEVDKMWYPKSLAFLSVLLAMTVSGCGDRHFLGGSQDGQVLSPFSVMDSTTTIFAEPASASPVNDHPLRWFGFVSHPLGMVLDYLPNRVAYGIASLAPRWSGYTTEDAILHELRSSKYSAPSRE
jgi:hypothetical protein